jgi:membrane protein implicated in regulation of membrane protease activity
MQELGRLLVVLGLLVALVGAILLLGGRIPWLGRLPGDILVRRGPVTFYFPLVTSLIVSIVLSLLLALFWRR